MVAVASTAWDMADIVSNNQLTTGQKVLGCGVAAGQLAAGFGIGMLAVAAFNFWNPVGWGLALAWVSAAVVGVGLSLLTNKVVEEAYKGIGITA